MPPQSQTLIFIRLDIRGIDRQPSGVACGGAWILEVCNIPLVWAAEHIILFSFPFFFVYR